MIASQRWLWLGVLPIAAGALIAWSAMPRVPFLFSIKPNVPSEKPAPKEPPATTSATSTIRMVGSATCSARGCHGALDTASPALDPEKCLQNEYVRWIGDRHAEAYQVLFNPRSERIMKLLEGRTRPGRGAHEDPRCLACHTNPQWSAMLPEQRPAHEERFGVGCESCHGPAEKWLVPHTNKTWRQLSAHDKWDKFGMVQVTDPTRLAQTCVGCHVGAPPSSVKGLPLRDVNHDLIAAGHPRLNFEYGSFMANMHPHWRPRKKAEGNIWAVGQVVSAQAALDLLSERAKSGPWPEFAEYNCFSCHHSLAQPSWRQTEKPGSRRPGSLAWGSWYFPLFRASDHGSLDELATMMEKPMPDRKKVHDQARFVRNTLRLDAKVPLVATNEDIMLWLKAGSQRAEPNWDSAEQIYLGLCALNQSQPDEAITKLLLDLTPIRAFSPGFDSPISWKSKGQPAFHPADFFNELKTWKEPRK